MKTTDKSDVKKAKIKKPIDKNKNKKVLIIAQEFKIARLLSGNDKKTRDRVLKMLKKWLGSCFKSGYEFKEDNFLRLWKGLFYSVWMSDKSLIQEELCESIASILDLFQPDQLKYAIMMMKAGFQTLATEWFGIDQHRIDKFMMLVRRYLRGCFRYLKRCEWRVKSCKMFTDMLTASDGILAVKPPSFARNANSMVLHFMDCYLEELSKVSQGSIPEESVAQLFDPFCILLCGGAAGEGARRLLTALLRQSAPGLEYAERHLAWKAMGCPTGGPDALVSDNDSDDGGGGGDRGEEAVSDDDTGPLDPRAGRVDVRLAPVPVPARMLAERLRELLAAPLAERTTTAERRRAALFARRFERLSGGEYPLCASEKGWSLEQDGERVRPSVAARSLRGLEKRLALDSDELALRGLSRKHRKRLLARSRAGLSIVPLAPPAAPPAPLAPLAADGPARAATSGEWRVESTEPNCENPVTDKERGKKRKREQRKEKVKKRRTEQKPEPKNEEIVESKTKKDKEVKKEESKKIRKEKKLVPNEIKHNDKISETKTMKAEKIKDTKKTILLVNKVKHFQKQVNLKNLKSESKNEREETTDNSFTTPKKVKFVLKNNSMQKPLDYYKSVRQSPNIPFDSSKKPTKTNLKPSTPSPINPFTKKKLKLK